MNELKITTDMLQIDTFDYICSCEGLENVTSGKFIFY